MQDRATWTLSRTTGMLALLIALLNEKNLISDVELAQLFDKSEVATEEAARLIGAV